MSKTFYVALMTVHHNDTASGERVVAAARGNGKHGIFTNLDEKEAKRLLALGAIREPTDAEMTELDESELDTLGGGEEGLDSGADLNKVGLTAKHAGGGRYVVMKGDELVAPLGDDPKFESKEAAEAFISDQNLMG